MAQESTFTVYNASAGSGKTYTLVKAYLSTLLQSTEPQKFRKLLAITFTNKAVAEMKERVLSTLRSFAHAQNENGEIPPMMDHIAEEIKLSRKQIATRSEALLHNIIHNYAAFDIVTIDTLTHRILRTFSKELGLSGNFEVSLQVKETYEKAVDSLIEKAGHDSEITETLVHFALDKTDEDKSWDISYDLNEIANLLSSENDRLAVQNLNEKTFEDFQLLKEILEKNSSKLKASIAAITQTCLELLASHHLEKSHFLRGSFFSYLTSLQSDPLAMNYDAAWKKDIDNYSFYKKTEKEEIKQTIDGIKSILVDVFHETRRLWNELKQTQEFLKKLTPLSVLRLIHKELQTIKEEENLLLISEFNEYIHAHLKNQPAAFIYERLGERYTNYFIDEFQDTSVLQWENLVPLIGNAVESGTQDSVPNSVLLVGDPKQAIYRWRGGRAEQFIALSNQESPFTIEHSGVEQLHTNWRSHKEIISFNNSFFSFIANELSKEDYRAIYTKDNTQEFNHRNGGFVSLQFVEGKNNEELEPLYLEQVLSIVNDLSLKGVSKSNICILTRKNSHGATIARHLAENNIQIVSSESLIIDNAAVVRCIHSMLSLQAQPDRPEIAIQLLSYLAEKLDIQDRHLFLEKWVHLPSDTMFSGLGEIYGFNFDKHTFNSLPLYEAVEYLIRSFHLEKEGDAYLFAYLDVVYEYTQNHNSGLSDFLVYWEQKRESLSVQAPPQEEAVQLMSIHRSKGLEFPFVIYPYADSEILSSRGEHHWYDVSPSNFAGFEQLLHGHQKAMVDYDAQGAFRYEERKGQQEFDAINLLYVAMTRAIEGLFVISRFRESKSSGQTTNYGQLFVNYLKELDMWTAASNTYTWGHQNFKSIASLVKAQSTPIPFRSSAKEDHQIQVITKAGFLWDEKRQSAISYGNLIHDLMAKIYFVNQLDAVIDEAKASGVLASVNVRKVRHQLQAIIDHSSLKGLFQEGNTVYNERPILSASGDTHIPDRVEIAQDGRLTILDYKTGIPEEKHSFQLERYASILEEMGYEIAAKKLVYVNDEISVLNV